MRRKDKEITDINWQYGVLKKGVWLTVAMTDKSGKPYIIPMNYGVGENFIVLHGARGFKTECIEANPHVAFNVTVDTELVRDTLPEEFSMKYRSVCGRGRAHIVEDLTEKRALLNLLLQHYNAPLEPLPEMAVKAVTIIKVDIEELTGKNSKYPAEEFI